MPQPRITFLHSRHAPQCAAHVDKHFEGYCSLQLMARGRLYLQYDDDAHHLQGRWLWPCWPGPRTIFHADRPAAHWEHYYVAFQGPLVEAWLAEGLIGHSPQPAEKVRDVEPRFAEMVDLAQATDEISRRRAANALEGLLLDMLAARSETTRRQETWLQRAVDTLSRPETYPVDYDALAGDLGMGTSTFRRKFRQATGQTPHHYALSARMSEAGRLLLESPLPIKAIADRLGFSDVHFFTRQFRQFLGVPPATFRHNLREHD